MVRHRKTFLISDVRHVSATGFDMLDVTTMSQFETIFFLDMLMEDLTFSMSLHNVVFLLGHLLELWHCAFDSDP